MTMTAPETYVEQLKNKSYQELLKERDSLIREIRYYEKHKEEFAWAEECRSPSPSTEYYLELQYLSELMKLIIEKYNDLEEE